MTYSGSRRLKWLVCALLGASVLAVFSGAFKCNLTDHDDLYYVTFNRNIQHGLTWHSLAWALTTSYEVNWHPLTWVSHMIDFQLYGLNPSGHHLTNLVLHAANSIFLFLLLNQLTGALWKSAFVAAIFALHPLRVESVVWISERKDVLSSFFGLLTIFAYVRYVREREAGKPPWKLYYGLAILLFACALMSKVMLVTLPFVLLLLDYWPLARIKFEKTSAQQTGFAVGAARLIAEKIPFFLMTAAASVATYVIQSRSGVVQTLASFPASARLAHVPYAYIQYICKIFWPSQLAVLYPLRPVTLPVALASVSALVIVTIYAIIRLRAQPFLAVGWFWFLGMLVPTIGVVQVTNQAMADRFSYLPSVGLSIMIIWGLSDALKSHVWANSVMTSAGIAAVAACMILTPMQVLYWQDSLTLFRRVVAVSDKSYVADYNLGCHARDQGHDDQAIFYYKRALSHEAERVQFADHSPAYNDLGNLYLMRGDITNAVACLDKAVTMQPKFPEAYYNLGRAFLANNQPDVAADCLQRAAGLAPKVAAIHEKLAVALEQLGRRSEAKTQSSLALQLRQHQGGNGGFRP